MSYRSTIFVHFCYKEDVVSKLSDIIMDNSCFMHARGIDIGDLDGAAALFFLKEPGGAAFEFYEIAKEICKYLKTVENVDVCVSMFIDGCGTISIEKDSDGNFYFFDGNVYKDIDEAIKYLSQ